MQEDKSEQIALDSATINKIREKGKDSFFFFARAILGNKDLDKDIHRPICLKLQNFRKSRRVIVILPRDWFKSTICSIAYPIWRAIKNPNVRILVTQNTFSNACKKLQSIKMIFEKNELFRYLYPEILPTDCGPWSKECLTVNRTAAHPEGTFEAAGTGTAVTSRHYDLIIEDDTVSPEKAALKGELQQPTQLEIEKAIGWHRVAYPLLLHPTRSQRLVVGTRWAVNDLIGWILKNSPEFELMTRSARENGKAVWDRFDDEVLTQLEAKAGPYMFKALYLNEPTDALNQVFKRNWIRYYQTLPKSKSKLLYCTSVDPAAEDIDGTSDPDYNVVVTTCLNVIDGHIYVTKIDRRRMNPGELVDAIMAHNREFHPLVVKIEGIAYQRTLCYWLQKRMDKLGEQFYVQAIKSHGSFSKEDRIRAVQPFFNAGFVHITTAMEELERELLSFPRGAHDDILDALSMQVDFWTEEADARKEEVEEKLLNNPLSGASIIEELVERSTRLHRYPADIGNMRDRIGVSLPRDDYVYQGVA